MANSLWAAAHHQLDKLQAQHFLKKAVLRAMELETSDFQHEAGKAQVRRCAGSQVPTPWAGRGGLPTKMVPPVQGGPNAHQCFNTIHHNPLPPEHKPGNKYIFPKSHICLTNDKIYLTMIFFFGSPC